MILSMLYHRSYAERLVITDSETYEFNIESYVSDYVERAVKTYERRRETSRAYYAQMKENPEWIQKRREREGEKWWEA